MKLYVSGKIGDTTNFVEKFAIGCAEVRAMGDEPVNPCDLHNHTCRHDKWEEWMVCDIRAMLDCDGVYALRDWKASPSATIEVELAIKLKKTVIYQGA